MYRAAGYSSQQDNASCPVPLLPGNTAHLPLEQCRPRSQLFQYKQGAPILSEKVILGPVSAPVRPPYAQSEAQSPAPRSGIARNSGAASTQGAAAASQLRLPDWITYDRKVLRYFAYFKESVPDSPVEDWRVRKCAICYHLSDGSLEVIEPREGNSGLHQGTFLKRHKAKLQDGSPVAWQQLTVGGTITLYGRVFHVVGCDTATRAFLDSRGVRPPPDATCPAGPFQIMLKEQQQRDQNKVRQPPPEVAEAKAAAAKARAHDRQVLRFFCCWDDPDSLVGDKLPYLLHYYLTDDTIEINEVHPANSGRDPFPKLLQRCRLPRGTPPVGARPPSPQTRREIDRQCYSWQELRLGHVLHVYGREMLLLDCDEFTRSWYRQKLGLGEAELQPIRMELQRRVRAPIPVLLPNTLGIGSEEDTAANAFKLIPKPPPRDYTQYLEMDGKVLRFTARLVAGQACPLLGVHDVDRCFVVSFYLSDGTLSIFEPVQKNSGLPGGRFLERSRVRRPNGAPTDYYTDQDLYVGARLQLHSRQFELLDADEYTLNFMEAHPDRYPVADYQQIMHRVSKTIRSTPGAAEQFKSLLIQQDTKGLGHLTPGQLLDATLHLGMDMHAHEVLTIIRRLTGGVETVPTDQLLQELGVL